MSINNKLRLLQWPLRARELFGKNRYALPPSDVKSHCENKVGLNAFAVQSFQFSLVVMSFQDNWIITPGDGSPSATSFVIVLLVVIRFSMP